MRTFWLAQNPEKCILTQRIKKSPTFMEVRGSQDTRLESTVNHLKAPYTLTPYCCTVPLPLYGVDQQLSAIWCSGHNWDLELE